MTPPHIVTLFEKYGAGARYIGPRVADALGTLSLEVDHGDGGGDHLLQLAAGHELAIPTAQPALTFPGDVAHCLGQSGLPLLQHPALAGWEAIGPGTFNEHASYPTGAGLGDAATPDLLAGRLLARHQAEIGH